MDVLCPIRFSTLNSCFGSEDTLVAAALGSLSYYNIMHHIVREKSNNIYINKFNFFLIYFCWSSYTHHCLNSVIKPCWPTHLQIIHFHSLCIGTGLYMAAHAVYMCMYFFFHRSVGRNTPASFLYFALISISTDYHFLTTLFSLLTLLSIFNATHAIGW